MKKVFLFVAAAFSFISSNAQLQPLNKTDEEKQINVIAYFCKNDTMDYKMQKGTITIHGTDTTYSEMTEERFRIIVRDSTAKEYRMELIPISYNYAESDDPMDNAMEKIVADMYCSFTTIFTTDEMGAIKRIDNWKEIREKSKTVIKAVCDSMYTLMPELETTLPRKRFESMLSIMYSSEKKIRETYEELQMLFQYHGSGYEIGKHESDEMGESGYPEHTEITVGYGTDDEKYGWDDDYFINYISEVTIPGKDAAQLASNAINTLLDTGEDEDYESAMEELASSDLKKITQQDCQYFFNGWPSKYTMRDVTDWNGTNKSKITNIEWTMRSWRTFDTPASDAAGTNL